MNMTLTIDINLNNKTAKIDSLDQELKKLK